MSTAITPFYRSRWLMYRSFSISFSASDKSISRPSNSLSERHHIAHRRRTEALEVIEGEANLFSTAFRIEQFDVALPLTRHDKGLEQRLFRMRAAS
jgi:hypothetical protein